MLRKNFQIIKLLFKEKDSKIEQSKFMIFLIKKSQNLLLLITISIFRFLYWILELKFKYSNFLYSKKHRIENFYTY